VDEPVLRAGGALFLGFERIDQDGRRRRDQKVIRGNGELVLLPTELRFRRWVPAMQVSIPLAEVRWTDVARSHNGRWMWRFPVLQVAFPEGTETKVLGVSVGRREAAERWRAEIDRLRSEFRG
jgi:hypothetical protein